MRDDICTIPVSEVFEVNDGCPICRMKKTVEDHIVDYIMGAAMMEPDVRIETNKVGFCPDHYEKMLNHRGRLALALMLETHLDSIKKDVFSGGLFSGVGSKAKRAHQIGESCFICQKINWGMERMVETIYRCYETERDFRDLFNSQSQFCMPHFEMLVSGSNKKMKRYGDEFLKNILRITNDSLLKLGNDVGNYCKMYNYHTDADSCDWENSKDSVERSIAFLTGKLEK